ncbi:hypothetical protein HDV01_003035 [Terramyces sp. JEL0728]|nr:hypothetical protein HDV01_003035 [Terramyces sp. JEL0728]
MAKPMNMTNRISDNSDTLHTGVFLFSTFPSIMAALKSEWTPIPIMIADGVVYAIYSLPLKDITEEFLFPILYPQIPMWRLVQPRELSKVAKQ